MATLPQKTAASERAVLVSEEVWLDLQETQVKYLRAGEIKPSFAELLGLAWSEFRRKHLAGSSVPTINGPSERSKA